MSARVAADTISHVIGGGAFPTLRDLLGYVGDERKEVTGDDAPIHQFSEPQSLPIILSFSNLTYSVQVRPNIFFPTVFQNHLAASGDKLTSETKVLLKDISGEVRDGEILAVLGASGSGKSTLLDALANRIAKGSLKGTVSLNGEPLESRLIKVISAYVMQDDLLFPMLTVEETLMFAAEFRLPRTLSKSKKRHRVEALIDQLGLRDTSHTVIGDEGHRGVSGGERRRVSIGIDIIHDPIILFLDEPTSGLDSTSAYMVVKVLRRIAQTGSVVIMSIHQPSYRLLGLLDRLLFLSWGQIVYSGCPSDLPLYFGGFGHPVPESENGVEFALDLIRELEGSPSGIKSLVEFNQSWADYTRHSPKSATNYLPQKEAINASIAKGKLVSGELSAEDRGPNSTDRTFANPFWVELAVLSQRSFTNSRRMPEIFATRLGTTMITGFILATIFWQLDNSPRGVRERLSLINYGMSVIFNICTDALPLLLKHRSIFIRETAYNTYRRSSYVLSHALVSLPSLVFLSLAYAAVTFWPTGLHGGLPGFFFYFFTIFACFWTGSSFMAFVSSLTSQLLMAYVIAVAALGYYLMFSGFYMTRDRIPKYWIWYHYVSIIKYPYEAVLRNEFQDPGDCFVKGVQIFDGTPLGEVPAAVKLELLQTLSCTLGMNITSTTCLTTGEDILKDRAITELSKWKCLWVTFAWGFLFRILFYCSLLCTNKNKRR